jgi:choice-of-anchor B domain-containing protein
MEIITNRCNEDTVTIVDVTNKNFPVMVARVSYSGSRFTHQGWLDDNHDYFVFGDEFDERRAFFHQLKTKTLVLEVMDLTKPRIVGSHIAPDTKAIDHNQYVVGQYTYQANYRAGLRILRINNFEPVEFMEVGYFDIFPEDDANRFNGAWSVYPFFPSGTIVVSGIEQGLFILQAGDLKATTTTSSGCSINVACSTWLDLVVPFRRPSGYRIHRQSGFFGQCSSRCVGELFLELRKNLGWECGSCP